MSRFVASSFRHLGFAFGGGNIFPSTETLNRIHLAVIGPLSEDDTDRNQRQIQAVDSVATLFKLLKKNEALYKALGDHDVFWNHIASEWTHLRDLESTDVKLIAKVYIKGRKASTVKNKTTILIRAVDAWIPVHDEVAAMPPRQTLTLTMRPAHLDATIANLNNLSIAGENDGKTWPPSYLNIQELTWISERHVASQLQDGLARRLPLPFHPTSHADFPALPENFGYPADYQLFLCFCGVSQFDPKDSRWALFMAPISFMDANDRKDFFLATGGLSKKLATIPEFYDYAKEMIVKQKRDLVIGMLTYWQDRPGAYTKGYEQDKKPGETRDKYWVTRCQKYAVGLAVRKKPNGGLQLIIYDMDYPNMSQHLEQPNTGNENFDELIVNMREWREAVLEEAKETFGGSIEVWMGGKKPVLIEKDFSWMIRHRDSISHTSAWIWDTLKGHFPDTTNADMVRWGYVEQVMWTGSEASSGSESEEYED
ncbi:hypothetical protein BJ170DRAFT_598381 [Xylariales sp. AK1849]|nr:hypothetical protein BJ170DRAFT_598381 [Xylariales sp. AK1849]